MLKTTIAMFVATLALIAVSGCASNSLSASTEPANVTAVSASTKTGAQLWAENCSRCHNFRPPSSFSDAQWHAIVHHMRLRANLTGYEQRTITTFLQNGF